MDWESIIAIVFIFGGGTLFLLAVSPVGKAIADRIRHGTQALGGGGTDPAVIEELERLRHDVGELQERVDFTERMLTGKKEAAGLPGSEGPS
jgi:hypothetical protein